MSRILLVEDDPDVAFATERRLRGRGHEVSSVGDGVGALAALRADSFDAVLLDLGLPDIGGLQLLDEIRQLDMRAPVIVLTGRDDAASAVRALHSGALDYLVKPVAAELLDHSLSRIAERSRWSRRLESIERRTSVAGPAYIGRAPAFLAVIDQLRAAAQAARTPVLISGDSGTGKEQAAARIHAWSDRASSPFVTANVAATPTDMLEGELFGHQKGAFTGASSSRRGLFELASGGVLFLDEIGEMPLDLQAKLLRAVEGHPFRRLGGEREIHCDVRIVSATHRNLAEEVEQGRFRRDLYHRLRVLEIALPSLTERREDIPLLADHFLRAIAVDMGRPTPELAPATRSRLMAYCWPGNVRELRNVIERAVVLGREATIGPEHLPPEVGPDNALASVMRDRVAASHGSASSASQQLDAVVHRHVSSVLEAHDGNVTRAAKVLSISRGRLRRLAEAPE